MVVDVQGPVLDPVALTNATGLAATHLARRSAGDASWTWTGPWRTDADLRVIIDDALAMLAPHEASFVHCVETGARVRIVVESPADGRLVVDEREPLVDPARRGLLARLGTDARREDGAAAAVAAIPQRPDASVRSVLLSAVGVIVLGLVCFALARVVLG